jgi:predicted metal-binding membrane protein
MSDAALAAVLRRDRAIVAACLVVLILLAWVYIVWLVDDMETGGMDMTGFRMIPAGSGLMMPVDAPWHAIEFAFVFAMWAVMMIGMTTPSATPLVLLYVRVGRQASAQQQPFAASAFLAGGYLLEWTAFSLIQRSANGRSSGWAYSRPRWQVQAVPFGG